MSATSQSARVLAVLSDGKPHSVPEIHQRAGTMRLNSRVSDLRRRGHNIVCSRVKGVRGPAAYQYQLLPSLGEITPPKKPIGDLILDGDVVAPRSQAERYRIYRVKDGGALDLIATCGTQEEVGITLCKQGAEGEFLDYSIGVLDGMDHQDDKGQWIGKWLVLPWFSRAAVRRLKGRTMKR